jgi:hypothetical protein
MKIDNRIIVILNITIPLVIGALIYYLLSPEVIFVKLIDGVIKGGTHFTVAVENNVLISFIRFYFLDMLWGYALVFALYFILDDNSAKLKKIFIVAFLFSAFIETIQLTPYVKGTFDCLDILFELLSEVIAVFIINILMRRH